MPGPRTKKKSTRKPVAPKRARRPAAPKKKKVRAPRPVTRILPQREGARTPWRTRPRTRRDLAIKDFARWRERICWLPRWQCPPVPRTPTQARARSSKRQPPPGPVFDRDELHLYRLGRACSVQAWSQPQKRPAKRQSPASFVRRTGQPRCRWSSEEVPFAAAQAAQARRRCS